MLSYNLQSLVNRRGQEATLVKVTPSAYNPATGSSSSTSVSYTVKAYFGNYSLEEMSNDSITHGDRRVVIPANDTSGVTLPEPDTEDRIEGVGDTVIIKEVQKIYNADTLVCYICRARE